MLSYYNYLLRLNRLKYLSQLVKRPILIPRASHLPIGVRGLNHFLFGVVIVLAPGQFAYSASLSEWSITGVDAITEGDCGTYTVSMSDEVNGLATVDLSVSDFTTSATDYDDLNTSVATAVNAYVGPGALAWDGATLTFTGDGAGKMSDLSFELCVSTDVLIEGDESFEVVLSGPTTLSCPMPEMLARIRINGLKGRIENTVTDFGSNGTTSTWTDQGTSIYTSDAGRIMNTTGENSQYTYSDNTVPDGENGYIEWELQSPLYTNTQLDVGFGNLAYPSTEAFIVDLNHPAGGWRTNGVMAGFIGVSDGNDAAGSTVWASGTLASDLYRVAREGCAMKWYRNGAEIRSLTRKATVSSVGTISSTASGVTTVASDLIDTDADGVPDSLDIDDDNDGLIDVLESPVAQPAAMGVQDTTIGWIDFEPRTLIGSAYDAGNGQSYGVVGTYDMSVLSPTLAGIDVTIETTTTEPGVSSLYLGVASGSFRSGESTLILTFSEPVDFRREHSSGVSYGPGEVEVHTTDSNFNYTEAGAGLNHITDAGDGVVQFDAIDIAAVQGVTIAETYATTRYTMSFDDNDGVAGSQLFRLEINELPSAYASANSVQASSGTDTDMDGISDDLDLDSDNDGISDLRESGYAIGFSADANGDGFIDKAESTDTDGDGIFDIFEGSDLTANVGTTPIDTDTDGVTDQLDLDSDSDGIPDTIEARLTSGYVGNDLNVTDDDTDGDGVIALFDSNDATTGVFGGTHGNFNAPVDTDGDAIPDYIDENSDNDAETDAKEGEVTRNGGTPITTQPSYADPDGSINDPLVSSDGSDLLENNDSEAAEVDYRSDPPLATNDQAIVAANTVATVDLSDNITDANNDQVLSTIDFDSVTAGAQVSLTTADGVWSSDGIGNVSFDPDSDFEGLAVIKYFVLDSYGHQSNVALVSVTVEGAVPIVTADNATVLADTNAFIDLSDNFTDANNDVDISGIDLDPSTAGIQNALATADGVWSIDTSGLLSFDPNITFEGSTSIPYTVEDSQGNISAPADVTVLVGGASPIATDESTNVAADTNATVDLSDNVTDANNDVDISTIDLDPATVGIQNTVATYAGVWSVDALGVVTFDPYSFLAGRAIISYTVEDDDGNVSAPANVFVTVASAAPIATTDLASVLADTNATVDLSDNVTDANDDVNIASIDLDTLAAGIQNTLTTVDGVWAVDANGLVTFDPDAAFEGSTAIPYTVEDDEGNVSAPADLIVTVGGAAPIATADSTLVLADTIAAIDLSDNVTDPNNDIDLTTFDLDPTTAGIQSAVANTDGVWSVDANGLVSFDPAAAFEGAATVPYTVEDDDGNVAAVATITVTVGGATPVATSETATVMSSVSAGIDLSDNVSDANNDIDMTSFDLDLTTPGVQNTLTTTSGIWSVDAAGMVIFIPTSTFEGTATIAYTVSDDDGHVAPAASIFVNVAGATPIATAVTTTVAANTVATIELSDSVSDANNDIDLTTIDLDPLAAGLQDTLTTVDGVWSVDGLGSLTFEPVAPFEGATSISYTVQDDDGNVAAAADVAVSVGGAIPVATADVVTTLANTNAVVDLSDNVTDANNDIDLTTIDLDPTMAGVQSSFTDAAGFWSVDAAGMVTFDPDSSFQGTVTVAYTVQDDDGNVSAPADVSVNVGGANPIATNDAVTVLANTNAEVDLSDNITDANNNVDISSIDLDPATVGIQNTVVTVDGVWSVDALGILTFDPTAAFEGISTVPYIVADADGNLSLAADVSVTVGGAHPIATNDSAVVLAGQVASVDLSDNVSDANNDIELSSVDLDPATAGIQNTLITSAGVWVVDSTGMVDFDPDSAFEGVASAAYTVEDDDGNVSAVAYVFVTVGGATPIAIAGAASVMAGVNATINLADNVTDANNDIDIATIDIDAAMPGVQNTLTTTDGVWSVDALGLVTFDPTPSFSGSSIISYTVTDASGNVSLPADIVVTVGSANPIADNDTDIIVQNFAATIDVLAGDNDANNDIDPNSIDLDSVTAGIQATMTIVGVGSYEVVAGMLVFTPDSLFTGVSSISYTISDAAGNLSNIASIEITVLLDTDADGVADINDIDDDNDGITDLQEGSNDTDSDGIIDSLDNDSDNDGITDTTEAGGTDSDGNGIIDGFTDTNGDGHDDSVGAMPLPAADTDSDNVPDYQDLDSDNDGLTDLFEAGGTDADNDGQVDGFTDTDGNGHDDITSGVPLPLTDTDSDTIADYQDTDSDNDGILDAVEGVIDTDADGIANYLDNDSDNDGIPDSIEGATDSDSDGVADYQDPDSDNDGIPDSAEGLVDSDADGVADYLDLDSDNDDIPDSIEGNVDSDTDGLADYIDPDSDNDGIPDSTEGTSDTDADGQADYLDTDSDNDGIADAVEGVVDTDADGVADHIDSDSDGDGIADAVEGQVDTDADGLSDYLDTDSDDDGLPDTLEGTVDTDNDGLADYLDPDSDNDGVPDVLEGSTDTDNDGIANYLDTDTDNDGIADADEGSIDTDNDGIPDYLDIDSDNDGIPDSLEGLIDSDADGIANYLDLDADNDDIADAVEGLSDTDADGVLNYLDTDSDNDGIADTIEGTVDTDVDGIADYIDLDSDNDTIPDAIESDIDTDSDGTPNYLDLDSDNDTIPDQVEAPALGGDSDGDGIDDLYDVDITGGADLNSDGVDDSIAAPDNDRDGIADYIDLDSDADGISDSDEAGLTPVTPVDTDGDGTSDFLDADSDNDNIADSVEGSNDTDADGAPDYLDLDSDSDGILDTVEGNIDSDGDTIPDYLDGDSDGDGIADSFEGAGDEDDDSTPDYLDNDADGDGIADAIEGSTDTDGDSVPNYLDTDSDGDGIDDAVEGETDTDGDGLANYLDPDSDGDGIDDSVEGEADADGDGLPNYLDSQSTVDESIDDDFDGDTIPDAIEGDTDTDGDGTNDYLDADSDDDGIPDAIEAGANGLIPVDTDSDGTPDYLDSDSDNDGIDDATEAGADPQNPVDTDGNGLPDYQQISTDADGDGIPDFIEGTVDTDADGVPDYRDQDSDDDGITDLVETAVDTDLDTVSDYIDIDADNDGISDALEQSADTDNDGVEDFRDLDTDNDGIFDLIEARIGQLVVNRIDADNNGTVDQSNPYGNNGMADIVETSPDSGIENYELPDVDGDGVLDFRDLDTDNDGLMDALEADHTDDNGNGVLDSVGVIIRRALAVNDEGVAPGAGGLPRNTDGDGMADFRDKDSDNDGLMDLIESFGYSFDLDNNGVLDGFIDANNDGVEDSWINLQLPINDTDEDGLFDAIELDADADGITDLIETGGIDTDFDGQIDSFTDSNNDGIDDLMAVVPSALIDTDRDSIPDFQDTDSDNDGLTDLQESGGIDADADGRADNPVIAAALPDADGDGVPDFQQSMLDIGAATEQVGSIITGIDGIGCAIADPLGRGSRVLDPMLPGMGLLALLGAVLRRRV